MLGNMFVEATNGLEIEHHYYLVKTNSDLVWNGIKKYQYIPRLSSLIAETVEGLALSLESVDYIHSSDRLSLGVLSVGDGIAHHSVQEGLQDRTSLVVDQTRNTLHTTSSGETANGGLGDTQNVITHHLAMSLSSSLSKSLSSFSTSRHFD